MDQQSRATLAAILVVASTKEAMPVLEHVTLGRRRAVVWVSGLYAAVTFQPAASAADLTDGDDLLVPTAWLKERVKAGRGKGFAVRGIRIEPPPLMVDGQRAEGPIRERATFKARVTIGSVGHETHTIGADEGCPVKEAPAINGAELEPADFLADGPIGRAMTCASTDESKPHVNAVYFANGEAVATDGHKLSRRPLSRASWPANLASVKMLLPLYAAKALARLVKATAPTGISLVTDAKGAWFFARLPCGGSWTLWTRTIDAVFPAYKQEPIDGRTAFSFNADDARDLFSCAGSEPLIAFFDDGIVAWNHDAPDGGIGTTLAAYPEGAPLIVLGETAGKVLKGLRGRVDGSAFHLAGKGPDPRVDPLPACEIGGDLVVGIRGQDLPPWVLEQLALAFGLASAVRPSARKGAEELRAAFIASRTMFCKDIVKLADRREAEAKARLSAQADIDAFLREPSDHKANALGLDLATALCAEGYFARFQAQVLPPAGQGISRDAAPPASETRPKVAPVKEPRRKAPPPPVSETRAKVAPKAETPAEAPARPADRDMEPRVYTTGAERLTASGLASLAARLGCEVFDLRPLRLRAAVIQSIVDKLQGGASVLLVDGFDRLDGPRRKAGLQLVARGVFVRHVSIAADEALCPLELERSIVDGDDYACESLADHYATRSGASTALARAA